ncbi:MAG: winged helix-turn-helix domain-containing protein, partial [Blastocatellia bacterium]
MSTNHLYRFEAYSLEPERRLLTQGGIAVPLPAKAFDILLILVQHAGTVVEKDDLMKHVWPDTIVEENNLTVAVSLLRKALNEIPNERRFIATVPGRGYQFVAEVTEQSPETNAKAFSSPSTRLAEASA